MHGELRLKIGNLGNYNRDCKISNQVVIHVCGMWYLLTSLCNVPVIFVRF